MLLSVNCHKNLNKFGVLVNISRSNLISVIVEMNTSSNCMIDKKNNFK